MWNAYCLAGCAFWGVIVFLLYSIRTKSKVHIQTMEDFGRRKLVITFLVMLVTILICTMPMGLSPIWNGEQPGHRAQYELMADAILNGHLYIDGYVDPILLEMENPYDPVARNELQVTYYWDHSFYDGHYYMYFGIVPVIMLFLPYRLITGSALASFHATQFFVALFICGVFATFYTLARRFFEKMTFVVYLFLSVAFAVMSTWYSVGCPAMYCTAITSALCMEIWSLFFFIRAVWVEEDEKRCIRLAFFGSLLGALAFGCRPPVALANLLVIPMLVEFLRKRQMSVKLFLRLAFAAAPYIVIGILLMFYNYVRFDNAFEFGQKYQLTLADQSSYGNFFAQFDLVKTINGVLQNFISYTPISKVFPYLSVSNGALFNFPILLFSVIGLLRGEVRKALKEKHIGYFVSEVILLPLLITVIDVAWAPELGERYRMDFYWLMGLACFLIVGFFCMSLPERSQSRFSHGIATWALITVFTCFMLYLVPFDGNYTSMFPEALDKIEKMFRLGMT